MPLSIFIDALPYNEMKLNYSNWFENIQISEMLPNIAYSSSLHWQLYCNKYPDDRGVFVDWVKEKEPKKSVRFLSTILRPLECFDKLSVISKKVLDRKIYRKNTFANLPYKFRSEFTEKGKYLFWNKKTYGKEPIFDGYTVISQDEGHRSFDETISKLNTSIENGDENIFLVLGFADALGHLCRRGEKYSERLKPYMAELKALLDKYLTINPKESILIVSDHGMSTVNKKIDLQLEKHFGKQNKKSYIAYSDSAIMCLFIEDKKLTESIKDYLLTREEGHLLTEEDRAFYKVTDRKFGDLIYILKEGNVFANNWFGKSLKKPNPDGSGMHGFWPEWTSYDQNATVILINGEEKLEEKYIYPSAHQLIKRVMGKE